MRKGFVKGLWLRAADCGNRLATFGPVCDTRATASRAQLLRNSVTKQYCKQTANHKRLSQAVLCLDECRQACPKYPLLRAGRCLFRRHMAISRTSSIALVTRNLLSRLVLHSCANLSCRAELTGQSRLYPRPSCFRQNCFHGAFSIWPLHAGEKIPWL